MSDRRQVTSDKTTAAGAGRSRHGSRVTGHAFTLMEMLTVLAIMGILAALVVPAFKNFGQSNAMVAATQQMVGGVARARQLAMSQRTTVYMVFLPEGFWTNLDLTTLDPAQRVAVTNLAGYQLIGFTYMAYGAVGDQPGNRQWHYLSPWQTLPEGTFIVTNKFMLPNQFFYIPQWDKDYHHNPAVPIYGFAETNSFPFPTETNNPAANPQLFLPYIAFNYLGQLTTNGVDMANRPEYIPLARGGVLPAVNPINNTLVLYRPPSTTPALPQVAEMPPGNSDTSYNIIKIDPLTGRASLEEPRIK